MFLMPPVLDAVIFSIFHASGALTAVTAAAVRLLLMVERLPLGFLTGALGNYFPEESVPLPRNSK